MTIVDGDPLSTSCDSTLPVVATPAAGFDEEMAAKELATFNDDRVVIVQCSFILGG